MNKKVVVAGVVALLVAGAAVTAVSSGIMSPYKAEAAELQTLCTKRFPTRPDYCECLVDKTRKNAGDDFPMLVKTYVDLGRFQDTKEARMAFSGKGEVSQSLSGAVGQCVTVWRSGSGIKFTQ